METDRATVPGARAARARDARRQRQGRVDLERAPVPVRCCATPGLPTHLQRAQSRRRKTSQRFEPGVVTLMDTPALTASGVPFWRTDIFPNGRQFLVTASRQRDSDSN